jgi:hypothetical protein
MPSPTSTPASGGCHASSICSKHLQEYTFTDRVLLKKTICGSSHVHQQLVDMLPDLQAVFWPMSSELLSR